MLRDVRNSLVRVARDRAALATILLLVLPWWSLLFLRSDTAWLDDLAGLVGTILAFWWMSRSGSAPLLQVKRPRLETLFAIALVVLWMGWRVGTCGKVLPFLPSDIDCFKSWQFATLPKLIEQVIFPIVCLFVAGYGWRAQGLDLSRRAWWIASPALVVFVGYGFVVHSSNLQGFIQNTLEYLMVAGLPEEVLFRAILLTRLEAWWRSPGWALFGASAIFGLSHLPVNYLVNTARDGQETWLMALTFQMGMGAVFAFAYQRTRNVWPVALLHALVDAL